MTPSKASRQGSLGWYSKMLQKGWFLANFAFCILQAKKWIEMIVGLRANLHDFMSFIPRARVSVYDLKLNVYYTICYTIWCMLKKNVGSVARLCKVQITLLRYSGNTIDISKVFISWLLAFRRYNAPIIKRFGWQFVSNLHFEVRRNCQLWKPRSFMLRLNTFNFSAIVCIFRIHSELRETFELKAK